MSEEILINVTPRETRVALVENGMLQELHIERASRRGVVGNVYKGRVQRVMPGMQAAFVEIGLERAAFLHASDILRLPQEPAAADSDEAPAAAMPPPAIGTLVHEGQEIVVQVVKDPIGSKGARLTTQISIPSRYLVLLPYSRVIGVSARIEDEAERARLKAIMAGLVDGSGMGCIVRTNAEGQLEQALAEDVAYLQRAWKIIRDASAGTPVGKPVYDDLSLPLRAMLKDVPLKSGGHLVVDQTEAMTTVDVNTGSFLGQRNLEETVYRTNLEAAQAVARQLRLRNLGGIIIIDFIDMTDEEHKRQVLRTLEKGLARDHAKTAVHDFSPLGLVEMTRKRTTDSLERQLCEPCHECGGRGSIKTCETIVYEIFREITRAVRQFEASQLLVIAAPVVVNKITDEESASVAELEEFLGKSIRFQADDQYAQEQFDVVLL